MPKAYALDRAATGTGASTPVPQYPGTPVHRYPITPVPQYTGTPVHKYPSTLVPRTRCFIADLL